MNCAWRASFWFCRTGKRASPRIIMLAGILIVGFYEKVIKVKADVAALLIIFDLRHISREKFALGSLRSDDWQLGRPTASPFLSVFP